MEVQERNATKIESAEVSDDTPDITGEDLMAAVAISSEPLEKILEVGFKLLCSGVGKIAGVKFNSTLMQQVSVDELERMVGEYAKFFILRRFLTN
jgi:hypothetical protein